MNFRLSVEFSLHCEFHDRLQKLEMCALHFIVILTHTGGFEQPVTEV